MGAWYSENDPRRAEQEAKIEAGDNYADVIGRDVAKPIEKPEQVAKKAATKRIPRAQN